MQKSTEKLENQINNLAELQQEIFKHKSAYVKRKLNIIDQVMDIEKLNEFNWLNKNQSSLSKPLLFWLSKKVMVWIEKRVK